MPWTETGFTFWILGDDNNRYKVFRAPSHEDHHDGENVRRSW
jgi:hypothetical protein